MSSQGVVLGISGDYHDAAAALLVDGVLVAAAAEERFTRDKHDANLPLNAMAWCLENAGVGRDDLSTVAFYSKPLTTYERILATHARTGPAGIRSLAKAVSLWSRSKLWVAYRIERGLAELGYAVPELMFAEHHQSHAAAAFHPSPFERAAVLTFDGVGEWATSSIGHGTENRVELLEELHFPDSLGLFYSTMTAHCGFEVNDGEYKLMGLAPFGEPRFAEALFERVVHLNEDGSMRLNPSYFAYRRGERMASRRLAGLLDGPPRSAGEPLGRREADIARSTQVVLEEVVLAMARRAHELTGESAACLAGGVALNCVANERILRDGPFEKIWVQPAAGDDGGAIGAAMWAWHEMSGQPRAPRRGGDSMSGCMLGPSFEHEAIVEWLNDNEIPFTEYATHEELAPVVAEALDGGAVVGWFQGRMEFGPRALGNRSILADPRDPSMIQHLNLKVKQREGFRPFAPAVLAERAAEWFDLAGPQPYMVVTAQVAAGRRTSGTTPEPERDLTERDLTELLGTRRSEIGACTHVDGSARVQTVDRAEHPTFHALLRAFEERTGCPVLLNTSFNGNGEPMVLSPFHAYECFRTNALDLLVLERCLIERSVVERSVVERSVVERSVIERGVVERVAINPSVAGAS